MINRVLFLPIIVGSLLWAGTAHAQEEASITLTARVLPTSAAGTASQLVVESEVGGTVTELFERDEEESPVPPPSKSELPRRHLVLRGQNQLLVRVQTSTGIERSLVSFSTNRSMRVDVGTLVEGTTVDIIHLSM